MKKHFIFLLTAILLFGCSNVDKNVIVYDGVEYNKLSENYVGLYYYNELYARIRPIYKGSGQDFSAKMCLENKLIKKDELTFDTILGVARKTTYYLNSKYDLLNIDDRDQIAYITIRARVPGFFFNGFYDDYKNYSYKYQFEIELNDPIELQTLYDYIDDGDNVYEEEITTNKTKAKHLFKDIHYAVAQTFGDVVDIGEVYIHFKDFEYLEYAQYIMVYDGKNDCYYLVDEDKQKETIYVSNEFLNKLKTFTKTEEEVMLSAVTDTELWKAVEAIGKSLVGLRRMK